MIYTQARLFSIFLSQGSREYTGPQSLVYSLEEFNPCESERYLQLETTKFPSKEEKKKEKIFMDLEIVGFLFPLKTG